MLRSLMFKKYEFIAHRLERRNTFEQIKEKFNQEIFKSSGSRKGRHIEIGIS